MKIALIGTGNVGSALGAGWARKGYEIVYGTRNPEAEKVKALVHHSEGRASAVGIARAAEAAEVLVLATPWSVTEQTLAGAGDLSEKILIDCTNPLAPDLQGLVLGTTTSGAEQVAEWAPGANVVKAFNTTGTGNMENPFFGEQRASMFVCGDDADAKSVTMELAESLGFESVDAGGLSSARYLEPMAALWITMAYGMGQGTNLAFKLLRR